MQRTNFNIIFTTAALLFSFICAAQESNKQQVAVLGRSYGDHIELRYFPTTPSLFTKANRLGYVIEKAIKDENKPVAQLNFQALKGSPFKRWSNEQWEVALNNLDASDTTQLSLAGFAMGLTSPGSTQPQTNIMENDLQSLKQHRDNADNNFSYVIIATCRSKLAAEGTGLRISDTDVTKGSIYVYRIRINEPSETNWAYLEIQCKDFKNTYLRNDKSVILNEDDKMISLSFPESEEYFAYNMYRSDDDGITYKLITDAPSIKLKPEGFEDSTNYGFIDSGLVNYKKYHYRLMVITPFADEMILSEFVAVSKDKTPPPAPFLKYAEHTKPREVKLTWVMTSPETGDMKGFNISRSNDEKEGYKLITKEILPATDTTFIDDSFTADGSNFYIVEAIDTAGNISRSFPAYVTLIDSTPPTSPVVSSAIIDSIGKVTIKVKPNTERDFMGYQLFKANAADHEFSVVEETYKDSLGATTFVLYDSTTLQTLTPKIYYKLVAFDTHFNQSEPSNIIELKRPDTIPPVSPLIIDFTIDDSTVHINFANSTSEDVVNNIMLRRSVGQEKFDSIFTNSDSSVTIFTDRTIIPGKQYEYAMIAKDEGNLVSRMSNTILLKTFENKRIAPPVITGSYNKEKQVVLLQFTTEASLRNKKLHAEIYQRTDQNPNWLLRHTIEPGKELLFTDEQVKGKKTVRYIVRLIDSEGKTSNFSNEIELIINP